MTWIQTHTGQQFWPLEPWRAVPRPQDVAHALAHMCRYNGHTSHFYSVAQHSVLIADALPTLELAWAGLWHDAAEAYLPDLAGPLRHTALGEAFRGAEHRLMDRLAEAFDFPWPLPALVKEYDVRILLNERDALLGAPPAEWSLPDGLERLDIDPITPWDPRHAEEAFLAQVEGLQARIRSSEEGR